MKCSAAGPGPAPPEPAFRLARSRRAQSQTVSPCERRRRTLRRRTSRSPAAFPYREAGSPPSLDRPRRAPGRRAPPPGPSPDSPWTGRSPARSPAHLRDRRRFRGLRRGGLRLGSGHNRRRRRLGSGRHLGFRRWRFRLRLRLRGSLGFSRRRAGLGNGVAIARLQAELARVLQLDPQAMEAAVRLRASGRKARM